jgi:hypothetical protein
MNNNSNNNNNLTNFNNNLYSETYTGENSTLLIQNPVKVENQKTILRCENSENFYVTKNKKTINLKKKETIKNNKNICATKKNTNQFENSYANSKKNLQEDQFRNISNYQDDKGNNNKKQINHLNFDNILERDEIKFK